MKKSIQGLKLIARWQVSHFAMPCHAMTQKSMSNTKVALIKDHARPMQAGVIEYAIAGINRVHLER